MQNDLGRNLENIRKQRKLSLRQASIRSGLSHAYIRDLELNKNRSTDSRLVPSANTLKKLADAYRIDYRDLYHMAGFLEDMEQESGDVLFINGKRDQLTKNKSKFLQYTLQNLRKFREKEGAE